MATTLPSKDQTVPEFMILNSVCKQKIFPKSNWLYFLSEANVEDLKFRCQEWFKGVTLNVVPGHGK